MKENTLNITKTYPLSWFGSNDVNFFVCQNKKPVYIDTKTDSIKLLSWSKDNFPTGFSLNEAKKQKKILLQSQNQGQNEKKASISLGIHMRLNPVDNLIPFCIDVDDLRHPVNAFWASKMTLDEQEISVSGRGKHYWGLIDRRYEPTYYSINLKDENDVKIGCDVRFNCGAYIKLTKSPTKLILRDHSLDWEEFLLLWPPPERKIEKEMNVSIYSKEELREKLKEYKKKLKSEYGNGFRDVNGKYRDIDELLKEVDIEKTDNGLWFWTLIKSCELGIRNGIDDDEIFEKLRDWSAADTRRGEYDERQFERAFWKAIKKAEMNLSRELVEKEEIEFDFSENLYSQAAVERPNAEGSESRPAIEALIKQKTKELKKEKISILRRLPAEKLDLFEENVFIMKNKDLFLNRLKFLSEEKVEFIGSGEAARKLIFNVLCRLFENMGYDEAGDFDDLMSSWTANEKKFFKLYFEIGYIEEELNKLEYSILNKNYSGILAQIKNIETCDDECRVLLYKIDDLMDKRAVKVQWKLLWINKSMILSRLERILREYKGKMVFRSQEKMEKKIFYLMKKIYEMNSGILVLGKNIRLKIFRLIRLFFAARESFWDIVAENGFETLFERDDDEIDREDEENGLKFDGEYRIFDRVDRVDKKTTWKRENDIGYGVEIVENIEKTSSGEFFVGLWEFDLWLNDGRTAEVRKYREMVEKIEFGAN